MYVYIYIYLYIYIYMYTCVCMYIYIYMYMCVNIHIYIHLLNAAQDSDIPGLDKIDTTCTHPHKKTCMYTCMYIYV